MAPGACLNSWLRGGAVSVAAGTLLSRPRNGAELLDARTAMGWVLGQGEVVDESGPVPAPAPMPRVGGGVGVLGAFSLLRAFVVVAQHP